MPLKRGNQQFLILADFRAASKSGFRFWYFKLLF